MLSVLPMQSRRPLSSVWSGSTAAVAAAAVAAAVGAAAAKIASIKMHMTMKAGSENSGETREKMTAGMIVGEINAAAVAATVDEVVEDFEGMIESNRAIFDK